MKKFIHNDLFVISGILLNASVLTMAKADLPTFTHVKCSSFSTADVEVYADICIRINFQDGAEDDYAAASYKGPYRDQNLVGHLIIGLDPVTITGNWRGQFKSNSEYYITIQSERLPDANRFYRNRNGSTSVVAFTKDAPELFASTHSRTIHTSPPRLSGSAAGSRMCTSRTSGH